MDSEIIYLDSNGTTRPAREVVAAMREADEQHWGNPSSVHRLGQGPRGRIELARESVSRLLGCEPREILFTSGGTEAIILALRGTAELFPDRPVFVSSRLEHTATRSTIEHLTTLGREAAWLPHDQNGVIDLDALRCLLRERAGEIALVTVMWVNNETGVIQPIDSIAELCRENGVRFHTDAAQATGKLAIDLASCPADLLTVAGHKLHAPKGIGCLFIRRGIRLAPQMLGGGQEMQRRGGTENTAGIVGLGAACGLARSWLAGDGPAAAAARRDRFELALLDAVPSCAVNATDAPRLWTTSNIAFSGLEAEAILMMLSERGVCASAGAACASGSLDPSPILTAMGLPEDQVRGSVRFSFSRETTDAEVDAALGRILDVVGQLG